MPITKRYQVFVSSTYSDLLQERQVAVQSILKLGHIPAGMELFAAGNKTQLEVIRAWIAQSDVFVLILGGRYGSIDPESGKSYVQREYEFAEEVGKPYFAVVMSDEEVAARCKKSPEFIEKENPAKLTEFRARVRSKICKHFHDIASLQAAIYESLVDTIRENEPGLPGWVSGEGVVGAQEAVAQVAALSAENSELRKRLSIAESEHVGVLGKYPDPELEELIAILKGASYRPLLGADSNALDYLIDNRGTIVVGKMGVDVSASGSPPVADLAVFGIVEIREGKTLKVTSLGRRLLAYAHRKAVRT